ncbi:hypothetical protein BpHYR1_008974 [Brachionus plicatilis]|uniref:Uncharacterized protein n=1 Tax=Brachionus plicatilis TaxID=10195 RepID=A0A3M7QLU2_BRAPC|nr:hypothetical protein BpHYR1_008974 [Brachionus plicatilis]
MKQIMIFHSTHRLPYVICRKKEISLIKSDITPQIVAFCETLLNRKDRSDGRRESDECLYIDESIEYFELKFAVFKTLIRIKEVIILLIYFYPLKFIRQKLDFIRLIISLLSYQMSLIDFKISKYYEIIRHLEECDYLTTEKKKQYIEFNTKYFHQYLMNTFSLILMTISNNTLITSTTSIK